MGLFRTITPDPTPKRRKSQEPKSLKVYKQPKQREPKPGEWNAAEALRRVGENGFYEYNK